MLEGIGGYWEVFVGIGVFLSRSGLRKTVSTKGIGVGELRAL